MPSISDGRIYIRNKSLLDLIRLCSSFDEIFAPPPPVSSGVWAHDFLPAYDYRVRRKIKMYECKLMQDFG